jgi:hypothetical protein
VAAEVSTDGALDRAVSRLVGALARRRGSAALHPDGVLRRCTLVVQDSPRAPRGFWGATLLDCPGTYTGVARLSRSAGLPVPLPDAVGLAVRLPGEGTDGAPLDLLMVTSWRHVPVLAPLSRTWSAQLPHRTGTGRHVVLGARPAPGGFSLLVANLAGRWYPWGRLVLGPPVHGSLRTDPTAGAPDLQHTRFLRGVRRSAYLASQTDDPGRPAPVTASGGADRRSGEHRRHAVAP